MEPDKEYLHERLTYIEGELYWKVVYSNRLKVGQLAGDKDGSGYRRVYINGRHFKMHRLIWVMFNGPIPEDRVVDHIDRDRSNNSIENLRLLTKSGNALNVDKEYTGASYDASRGKWRAQISLNNKNVFLGRFNTFEMANAAYLAATATRK